MAIFLLLTANSASAQNVQITGLVDFNFGTWNVGTTEQASDGVCIHKSGTGARTYLVTGTGSGSGGDYTIASGANELAYTLEWDGGPGGFKSLVPATSKTFSGASRSQTCNGGTNAEMRITFDVADLDAAIPGDYSGSLTLLIEPI
ncbi:MAG: hypothetical protein IT291_02615 [Deltaproteobacteria bacterium]|nr:hypothetical protein [Deltaproteobacteria bacterium]